MRPTDVSVVGSSDDSSVRVSFRLGAGCYATALLRELLQCDDII